MLFKCSVCNFTYEGDEAPDFCPKCGAPKEKFNQLDEAAAKKVYASDETNDLLMKFVATAHDLIPLCERGIEINLDPACRSFFTKAKDALWTLKQNAKAEIENHIGKGKW